MDFIKSNSHPVGRVFLGILFLMAGIGKVAQMGAANFAGYIDSVTPGLGMLAWPIMLFEILAGAAIILGFQTRLVALALVLFCLFTGIVFHGAADMTGMMKNIGLAGGYLLLVAHGAGRFSIDNR